MDETANVMLLLCAFDSKNRNTIGNFDRHDCSMRIASSLHGANIISMRVVLTPSKLDAAFFTVLQMCVQNAAQMEQQAAAAGKDADSAS